MEGETRILAISGSISKRSYNSMLIDAVKEVAPSGVVIEKLDVGGIPIFNRDLEDNLPEKVKEFKAKIMSAHAILIATPEYDNSVPAVLKNALEWISRPYGNNSMDRKAVGILSASTELGGGMMAQYQLRHILTYLNAFVLNKPVVLVPSAHTKFDQNGKLTDNETRIKIKALLENLLQWAKLIDYGVNEKII
jgi:chromate reductase, NAD(P)H dehydrogenase (quinone)